MLENMRVKHYRNGIPIPNLFDKQRWSKTRYGAYCLPKNDTVGYKNKYGVLYNYYALINNNKLSPKGWHIPTERECMELINYLGGISFAGEKIKTNILELWKSENVVATNESGFNGVPAGGSGKMGEFGEVGHYATWWSSTSYDSLYAWHWGIFPIKKSIRSNPGHKSSGFSVRCIKDN
jgi:uncharacterized protein (TIGR02145 family)